MSTIVYEYGLLQPTVGEDVVLEQLWLAGRYYNKLIEIERARRQSYTALLLPFGNLEDLEEKIGQLDARCEELRSQIQATKTKDTDTAKAQRKALQEETKGVLTELKVLRVERKRIKSEVAALPEIQAKIEALNEEGKASVRAARAASGVFWGTYLQVEAAAQAACEVRGLPSFRRYHGEGCVAFQFQGGLEPEKLFEDSRVHVDRVPPEAWDKSTPKGQRRRLSRTKLRMRVRRNPTTDEFDTAEWPMIMHRPLPANASIKWVKVLRFQRHEWFRWVCQITVDVPDVPEAVCGTKASAPASVGIDLGWRTLPNKEIRTAYWCDSNKLCGELILPASVRDRIEKAESLRSIRDNLLNEMKAKLQTILSEGVPEAMQEAVAYVGQWRSPARFAQLRKYLKEQKEAGALTSEPLLNALEILEPWYHRDKHLWQYEGGVRRGAIGHRREVYRKFALELVSKYNTIYIEDFKLTDVIKRPAPEHAPEKTAKERCIADNAAHVRTIAAVGLLRQIILSTAKREGVRVIKVPAPGTTATDHVCGKETMYEDKVDLVHTCAACGSSWDQDYNAGRNILASGEILAKDSEAFAAANLTKPRARVSRFKKAVSDAVTA